MTPKNAVALCLADSFLAGPLDAESILARGLKAIGVDNVKQAPWLSRLVGKIKLRYGRSLKITSRVTLAHWIANSVSFGNTWSTAAKSVSIRHYFLDSPEMRPRPAALSKHRLPKLATCGDLAHWLGVPIAQLDWFTGAIAKSRRPAAGPLAHYHYQWMMKRSSACRLLEIPKSRLREMQRRILRLILDRIPAHLSAHGFVRGRSCATHVVPHIGQRVVMRIDLKNFFPSIPASRVHALFATLGYPEPVARALTGLCTHQLPGAALRAFPLPENAQKLTWTERKQYQIPHLPQGAPTSPALANLCAYRLDVRLAAAASAAGASYTRYADDLVFSGSEHFARATQRFHILVCRIAMEEDFEVNTRKTRVMLQSVQQKVTGIVMNQRPNIPRVDFDRLKATLTNCVRHGPQSQNIAQHANFKAHLNGKIAYVQMLNAKRAYKLRLLFDQISWVANTL
jgi:RNA-directed DNA polymerase